MSRRTLEEEIRSLFQGRQADYVSTTVSYICNPLRQYQRGLDTNECEETSIITGTRKQLQS